MTIIEELVNNTPSPNLVIIEGSNIVSSYVSSYGVDPTDFPAIGSVQFMDVSFTPAN
jgi:hypothetical protein